MRTFLLVLFLTCAGPAHAAPRVLVYQRNGRGFVHDNLAASATCLRELGAQHGFGVDVSSNAAVFADATLGQYQAIIFANSNNEAFETDVQRAGFQRFIRAGGGFMGIHSSTGSERQWDWFQQMQGAKFLRHSPMQSFQARVVDAGHPATAHLSNVWTRTDECYFFTNLNERVRVLLAADTNSLRDPQLHKMPAQRASGVFPLAWCQEFEGGRQFYTSLGHKIAHYSDPAFRQHLLGGIRWVLGLTNLNLSLP
jgi:type 1 glutamine amidotransferase